MKKVFILSAIVVAILAYGLEGRRKFYSFPNGKKITVWSTLGDKVFIIPGEYWGPLAPGSSYIESPGENYIDVFYSPQKPNQFVFRPSRPVALKGARVAPYFELYGEDSLNNNKIYYIPNAIKFKDLNEDAMAMSIDLVDGTVDTIVGQ